MNLKLFLGTFFMIFIAELGDKTQLATLSFAAQSKNRLTVFLGASAALTLTSLIAVLLGNLVNKYIPGDYLRYFTGVLFIGIGILFIVRG